MFKKLKRLKEHMSKFFTPGSVEKTADNSTYSLNNEELHEREIRTDEKIKRTPVEGTPFYITEADGKTFISIGLYKVSEAQTYEKCLQQISDRDWTLILNVARLLAMAEIRIDQETKKAEQEQAKKMAMSPNSTKYH